MSEFRKPAIKISQGKRVLFVTTLTVRDFMRDGFCQVDMLDVKTGKGMQRLLQEKRAKELSKYIAGADEEGEAMLPTAILLATQEHIDFDECTHEIYFDFERSDVCPFNIVDGQHRVEGLKMAVEEKERILDFSVPVIIAPNMTEADQMLQFVIVNKKQEKVGTDVVDYIIAWFHKMVGLQQLPYIPGWLKREIERDTVYKALRITKQLHERNGSPWCGRIQLATVVKDKSKHTITQKSFSSAIKKLLLVKDHPLSQITPDEERQIGILCNYWQAVSNIFVADDPLHSTVFKTIGLKFFLMVFKPVLVQLLLGKQDYAIETIEECICSAKECLLGESALVFEKTYWQRGGGAGKSNDAGIRELAANFSDALAKANHEER